VDTLIPHLRAATHTTKDVGKGTGLGLSTVFGIVKQNDGFLNIYSEPHLGATFRIYLKRYLGADALDSADEGFGEVQHGRGRILVVEDDEILRGVIPHILNRLGYTFLMADTPGQAMHICRQPEIEIDVLLTDVVMPYPRTASRASFMSFIRWKRSRVISAFVRCAWMPLMKAGDMSQYTSRITACTSSLRIKFRLSTIGFALRKFVFLSMRFSAS
jgi:CheY-like chemotaxis protein